MAEIDDRVVSLKFDNATFQAKISETLASLSKLQASLDTSNSLKGLSNLNTGNAAASLDSIANSVDGIGSKFNAMGAIAFSVISNIANKATDFAINFGKQFTVAPIMDGFREMETKVGSIQTILANTSKFGTTLPQVTTALDDLNTYSDKTIYNFGQMTKNVGLFTNAGIRIEDATSMIKGFSNAAAASGTNAEGAASAAYQLSQALSAGKVTLMDWRSLQNVGMGNQNMKDGILEIAKAMGTLEETGTNAEDVQKSFNTTLEKGWLTADVMSTYLKTMAGDMDATKLKALGLSDSVIATFREQQKTAEDAATKIRTFTQLISTVKESVASGWSTTFTTIIGDFNQATDLFTSINDAVGGFVGKMSDARNELLKGWAELGGRQWLLDAFKIVLGTIGDLLKTLGVAFRKVFPPATAETLVRLSWVFQHLARLFDEAIQRILPDLQKIFEAVFSTIKLGFTIVKSLAGFFIDLFKALYPGESANGILGFFGNLAGALTKLNMYLIESGVPGFFKMLSAAIVKPIEFLGQFVKKIVDLVSGSEALESVASKVLGFVKNLGTTISAAFADISKAAEQVFGVLFNGKFSGGFFQEDSKIVDTLFDIREAFERFGDTLLRIDLTGIKNKIVDFFNLGGSDKLEAAGKSLKTFSENTELAFQTISSTKLKGGSFDLGDFGSGGGDWEKKAEGIKGFVQKVGDFVANLGDALSGFGKRVAQIGSDFRAAIVKFFTGSEIVSSNSGFETLVEIINTVLFTGILLSVATFMRNFSKLVKDAGGVFKDLSGILKKFGQESKSTALIKIGVALVLLAGALKVISDIDRDALTQSFAALGVGLIGMATVLTLMNKLNPAGVSKIAGELVLLALALRVMASAIKVLAELEPEELKKGMIAAGVGIGILAGATRLMSAQGPGMIAASTAIVALSAALLIMAVAIKLFAAFDPVELAIGLTAAIAAMLGLGLAASMIGPGFALAGPSIVLMAGALIIIAEAVRQFGAIKPDVLAKGLGAIFLALAAIAGTLGGLPPSFFLAAAAMPIVAGALLIMGDAIKKIGEIKGGDLAKGLAGMALALTIVAVAVNAMSGALAGAAALLIVSYALGILTEVLIKLGSQDLKVLAVGLGVLTAALLVLAAAGIFLAGPLLALGAAMLLLGAGFLLFGIGAAAAVAAFVYFSNALNENSAEIIGVLKYLAKEIPAVITLFAAEIAKNADAIAGSFSIMVDAIEKMIVRVLDAVIAVIPKFIEVVDKIVDAILQFIENRLVDFIDMGFAILLAIGRGLLNNIGELVTTAVRIVARFARALADEMPSIIDSGIRIVRALAEGLGARMNEIVGIGVDLIISFVRGIAANALRLANAAADVLVDFLNGLATAIETQAPRIRQAGVNVAMAIISGITGGLVDARRIREVTDAAREVARNALNAVTSFLGISSPSKVFMKIGGYMTKGLALGLDRDVDAENSAVRSAERIVEAFAKTFATQPIGLPGLDASPRITPILDLSQVAASARGLNAMMEGTRIRPSVSFDQARMISAASASNANEADTNSQNESTSSDINFVQNNYSPEALSANDIYRNTKSQIALAKEELNI